MRLKEPDDCDYESEMEYEWEQLQKRPIEEAKDELETPISEA